MNDITHNENCQRPDPFQYIGTRGDLMRRCGTCRAFTVVKEAATEPEPDTGQTVGRYVCRDHHTQPVTPKGHGCRPCKSEQDRSRRNKQARQRDRADRPKGNNNHA